MVDGPHAELLRLSAAGVALTRAAVLGSSYGRMATACIDLTGRYFSATDEDGVVEVAQRFLAMAAGEAVAVPPTALHSAPGLPVLAVPIAHSDCYQVLDGHHRIALAAEAGRSHLPVRVRRGTVETPLQDHLARMSWLDGSRELYQPVEAPELATGWTTVRRCTDRMNALEQQVAALGLDPTQSSSLDVASCYGWFVAQMLGRGFDASGIERDPLAPRLGHAVYGLDPSRIQVGDAVEKLAAAERQWDVVSCFSLLHHFVLGRGSCPPTDLLRLLDRATGRVLFLDTGQEHEEWFRRSLRGWDAAYVAEYLAEHTTFDRVVDLGPDEDAVAPYERNYGRHLFACIRDVP